MNQLLHTPEGVRDIYNDECERKIILEERLLTVLKSYGYHPIQTPTFEFFDILEKKSVPHRPRIYTSFLTGKEIPCASPGYHTVYRKMRVQILYGAGDSNPVVLHR